MSSDNNYNPDDDFAYLYQADPIARGQWFSATTTFFYEHPSEDMEKAEIWCYTDHISYQAGDKVDLHISTTASEYDIKIIRDGLNPEVVFEENNLKGQFYKTPKDAYAKGCHWPEALSWQVPDDVQSGGYIVVSKVADKYGNDIEQQHIFIVRPSQSKQAARKSDTKIVLVAATCTWAAYNEWGGANAYEGVDGDGHQFSPTLSLQRPWSRGFVWLPEGAPRIPHTLGQFEVPRYPNTEFAFANGFSKYYAAAGWAMYERLFVCWAEKQGLEFDIITQHDLHQQSDILDDYNCAVFVGHDEYWSREMRDHVDAWVDNGGNVARFGGNYCWQIRLENDGKTQVCYKYRAQDEDPVVGTDQTHLLTSGWEDLQVNYPGASTMGLNGFSGVYVGVGGTLPRSQRGFTVYRSEHWAFENTDLYYGDILGGDAGIYGFEVDGVDYTFNNGLPYPVYGDGAPPTLQILAMGLATKIEEDHKLPGANLYLRDADAVFTAQIKTGEVSTESIDKVKYGSGMIAHFTRGQGEVFNAASCEWVVGLKKRDPYTEQVTLNVLTRYSNN